MDTATRYLDRPAAVLGVAATALSWMAGIPSLLGLAIGGMAFGIASAGKALQRRSDTSDGAASEAADGPSVQLSSSEERWVRRGTDAVASIAESLTVLGAGPLRDRLTDVAEQARDVLEDVRTLAAQATATRLAGRQLDASRLTADLSRLTSKLDRAVEPDMEEDLRRSLDAVREQLGIYRRLESARNVLQARIESGSLGLQRLAAQVSEMTALASPDALGEGRRVDELSTQLEALRSGLGDAGALSRRALGGTDIEGGRS